MTTTTTYVTWPKTIDTDFRAAYLEQVEENIQASPMENQEGTHYLVGSSKVKQEHIDVLAAAYDSIQTYDTIPEEFLQEQEGE